jgi:PAS domain S-box-containing protein
MKKLPPIFNDYLPGLVTPRGFQPLQGDKDECLYLVSCTENAFKYMDHSFLELTGYSDRMILTEGIGWWFSLIHPDDVNPMLNHILLHCFLQPVSKRLNKPFFVEFRLKHSDGEWIWIRETKSVVSVTKDGKNDFIIGLMENIDDIKKEEEIRMDQLISQDGMTNPLLKAAIPIINDDRKKQQDISSFSKPHKLPEGTAMPTKREKEILQLIGEGYSTKQIADKLHISINTVETHRRHLLEKIQVKNSMELIKQTSNAFWLKAM